MSQNILAVLASDDGVEWKVHTPEGFLLVSLRGAESRVLGPARASLRADHGFPDGDWVGSGDWHYRYVQRQC